MICDNLSINSQGHLCFAGQDTTLLAETYGTPLYLMDEDKIRANCRLYKHAMQQAFGKRARVLYAGKAAAFRHMYTIMKEEGMGIDVVSAGEIYTAVAAGFPMAQAYFHGNNKTDADISFAMDHGVGYFVVDNQEELEAIRRQAAVRGIEQQVLLRLTPGIDPHTFAAVATGKVDSKFGSAIETGQAEAITAAALSGSHIRLVGFHCHVGSMVFDAEVFISTAAIMLRFIAHIRDTYGYTPELLDLGGGFGVRYIEAHPTIDIPACIEQLAVAMKTQADKLRLPLPVIALEPGRSIVADAGMTLYTVGTVKTIPAYKNYVSVDGGMTDNPRYALYGSPYTVLLANRAADPADFPCSVVGRCCESGDIIQENIALPSGIVRGELIAVLTTGAYNYSMASNYNRIPRPPIVLLQGGGARVAVRRETLEDLLRADLPCHLKINSDQCLPTR
ncbi:MAG: diaminopimelate decarboxylase [Eubacteriales bacterium]